MLRGTISSLLVRISAAIAILAGNIVLARQMTPTDFGYYNYLIVSLGFVALALQWGVEKSVIKFVPAYVDAMQISAARHFVQWANRRILVTAPIAVLSMLVLCWVGNVPLSLTLVLGVTGAVVGLALTQFWQQVERSLQNIVRSQIYEQILLPLSILLFCAAMFLLSADITLAPIVSWYSITMLSCCVVLALGIIRRLSFSATPVFFGAPGDAGRHAEWKRVTYALAIGGLMSYLLIRGEVVIIGWFLAPAEVAKYAIALRVANLLIFGLSAVTAIAGPRFSAFYHSGKQQELQRAVSWGAAFSLLLSLPLAVVILFFPESVLAVFGSEYRSAAAILQVLIVANIINVTVGPVAVLMMVAGQERVYVSVVVVTAALKLVCVIPAAILFDSLGVAVVSAAATVGWTIALALYANARLKLVTLPFWPVRGT